MNEMLDAILFPSERVTAYWHRSLSGKIDELIAQTYKGDHEKMKIAVNNVGVVLQGLQKELGRLIVASRDGQLSERGKQRSVSGRLLRHRARRERNARCDSASHW